MVIIYQFGIRPKKILKRLKKGAVMDIKRKIFISTLCILIACSGCSGFSSKESEYDETKGESKEYEVNNDVFSNLENVSSAHVYSCISGELCTKKRKEITHLVSLLQSICLESIDEQDMADGQINFWFNEGEENVMDVINYGGYICANGKWYFTEDTDIMDEVEDILMSFEKVT